MKIGADAHWIVRGRLLASRAPHDLSEMRSLAQEGVTHVLSLVDATEEEGWSSDAGLEYQESKMDEMGSPSVAQVQEALSRVLGALRSGNDRCVLVHCHAGIGRAGVVAAAFLGTVAGLTPEEAVSEVRHRRPGALWSQDKEVAVEEFLRAFAEGKVRLEGEHPCPRCETRILHPRLCFRCSGATDLDAFLGAGS
ncbi:MAG: dual specificity protein phosphatase family protein [Euryarchaeota archaeon]|nr:dual specificity protein phosphatase family protein [Euryarchaeota archaeon]MDE1835485.1 dual specificity protein phosphatase family protein [Euryarchaeota archaeon]MDE1880378.1 dual specificity protein phosphatase family protein [Euryarchaeota archaeon]MDE2045766.1 dual specificity protein phosphatase family protein [Thermoplasmata archaeon]